MFPRSLPILLPLYIYTSDLIFTDFFESCRGIFINKFNNHCFTKNDVSKTSL